MKTLHNIFHKNLIKKYLLIFAVSLISLIFSIATTKIKPDSSSMSFMMTAAYIVAAIGPFVIFFVNTSFPYNVNFLINQHFNRLELIKFFFFSQTLKVILVMINYCILGVTLFLMSENPNKLLSLPEISYLYSNYFIYFILALSGLYFLYPIALFGANKQDLQKNKVAQSALKKNKKKQWIIALTSLFILHLITNQTTPDAVRMYLYCLFISYTSLMIINRTFKLYNQKKSYVLAGFASFVICVPLIVIIYGMKKEAHNPEISYKLRAKSVVYLNWMNTNFSEDQMLGFLAEADDGNYNRILKLFGDNVDFDSSLSLVSNEYRGKKFIDFHLKKHSHERVEKVVTQMSKLMKDKKLSFEFAQYFHSYFVKQKMEDIYIEQLVKSNNPFEQLASIYFAKNSFSQDKFIDFYNRNFALLDKAVINDRFVKRSIASEKN